MCGGFFLFTIDFINVVTESISRSLCPIGGQTVWRCYACQWLDNGCVSLASLGVSRCSLEPARHSVTYIFKYVYTET